MDYYRLLGVSSVSSPTEIRTAYRQLAMKWHPLRHKVKNQRAIIKFAELGEAYEILSDPAKRKDYDSHEQKFSEFKTGDFEMYNKDPNKVRGFDRDAYDFKDPHDILRDSFFEPEFRARRTQCDNNNKKTVKSNERYEVLGAGKVFERNPGRTSIQVGNKLYFKSRGSNEQIIIKRKEKEDGFDIVSAFIEGVLTSRTVFDGTFSMTFNF